MCILKAVHNSLISFTVFKIVMKTWYNFELSSGFEQTIVPFLMFSREILRFCVALTS
jgi:hypothetical protein